MSVAAAAAGYADRASRWAAIALGASIPVSVALDGALMAVVLAGFLAGGAWAEKWRAIRGNPVALAALALFALLAAGTLYGEAGARDAVHYLSKYVDLLFIPVFIFLFRDARGRRLGLQAFAAALLATVLLSFALHAGMPRPEWFVRNAAYPACSSFSSLRSLREPLARAPARGLPAHSAS
jgi:putative effector of murein hydrolase LrgA (UPF0299 family)